jgi:hypothetical protein
VFDVFPDPAKGARHPKVPYVPFSEEAEDTLDSAMGRREDG